MRSMHGGPVVGGGRAPMDGHGREHLKHGFPRPWREAGGRGSKAMFCFAVSRGARNWDDWKGAAAKPASHLWTYTVGSEGDFLEGVA